MLRVFSIQLDCEFGPSLFLCSWLIVMDRFAPLLQKNGTLADPSRVIITASIAGIVVGSLGKNATFGYSASKAAAIHLAKNLAVELGPRGVLVNAIAPGFFPSKMASELIRMTGGADQHAAKNPNRRLGKPEDIAGLVVFLSSRASSHVNGACLVVDGGESLTTGGFVTPPETTSDSKAKL